MVRRHEYFRNDALDANDFFNNSNGLPRTVLKQNQFGVSVGGTIHRNSHFVFGNWKPTNCGKAPGRSPATFPQPRNVPAC